MRWYWLPWLTICLVIGERVVSPSAIVYLVVKLRLKSPISNAPQDNKKQELDVDEVKRRVKRNDEQEEEFLKPRSDAEEMKSVAEYAHAHWPGERKLSWWIVLADGKSPIYPMPDYPTPTQMKHYLSTTTEHTRFSSKVPTSACSRGRCTSSATHLLVAK